jgi:hypothetical protein
MLIILEGVDGAGKTYLKDQLAHKHGIRTRMLQSGPLFKDPMIAYEWALREYDRRDLKTLWICDGWHVSEMVYGPLYHGHHLLTEPIAKHIEMFLSSLGALKIIITESPAMIEDRLAERAQVERLVLPEHVGLVWDFFNEHAEVNNWRLVTSLQASPQRLIKQAKDLQIEAFKIASMKSYVGSLQPKFLVLSGSRSWPVGLPSFYAALTPARSVPRNHAIMQALLPYEDFGILSQDGDQIKEVWPVLGRPPVIATDPEAKAACVIAGIPVTPIRSALVIMAEANA